MKTTMNTLTRFALMLGILVVLGFNACKKGDLGPQGPEGTQGPIGPQGIAGTDGKTIHNGTGVPAAALGGAGDFYLDVKTANLYGPKTAAGWGTPTSLKGPTGERGATGATGARGATGAAGSKGDKGDKGSQFLSGMTNPANGLGVVGDFYLNSASGTLFGPKIATGWGTGVNLKGVKGDKGDKGEKGDKGDPGNANVKQYVFTNNGQGYDLSSHFSLVIPGRLDGAAWYVYLIASNAEFTYPIPGLGQGSQTNYRAYLYMPSNALQIVRISGPGEHYQMIKVVVIESSSSTVQSAVKQFPTVNFGDYKAVATYFGLQQ